jgi:uncharacterized protein
MSKMNLGVLAISYTAFVLSTPASAASYDCKRSKTFVERKICKVPELSKLDDELSVLYKDHLSKMNPADAELLKQSQRQWIVDREKCSSVKAAKNKDQDSFKDCLLISFDERKKALSLQETAAGKAQDESSFAETYSNEDLKFKISYPSTMKAIRGTSVEASLSDESWSEFYKLSDPKSKQGTLLLILDTGTRAALRIGYRMGSSEENACSDHSKETSLAANGQGFEKKTIAGQDFFVTVFGDAGMQKFKNAVHFETFLKDRCLVLERSVQGVQCSVYEEGKERQDCESAERNSKAAYEELDRVIQSLEFWK